MDRKKYPIGVEHYTLYEEVGTGVSASVHRALCIPYNEIVAIKILDFERDNCDLNNISREAQTMVLVDHPNVLKSHCSFVSDHTLWVVMPYMAGGSCLHILKAVHPDGFEEVVIATVLREVLKGLDYLHSHGHIHRDVKAGNILLDSRGGIKLGDFGVSACLFDSGDRQRMRNTFVGTPCWMAPEVMEQLHGYDFKADIWSFGITALELAHGHAPFSKYPPMKVLLMTLQNAPPGLDYERDKKFSKSFKQMIASCLVKDPTKRPSAKKLLKHPFFKQARSNDYIARTLLDGLPALGDRLQALKIKEQDMLAQKKIPDGQKEEMSQNEYKRGISGWNFDLEDMKAQASLIQDEDTISEKGSSSSISSLDAHGKQFQRQSSSASQYQRQLSSASQYSDPADLDESNQHAHSLVDYTAAHNIAKRGESDDDASISSSIHDHQNDFRIESNHLGKPEPEANGKLLDNLASNSHLSCLLLIIFINLMMCIRRPALKLPNNQAMGNNDELDEKTKIHIVQQKGRFKVTSENVDFEKVSPSPILQKSHSMQVISQAQYPGVSVPVVQTEPMVATPANTVANHCMYPMLQSVLQANIVQRESILGLMRQLCIGETTDGGSTTANPIVDKSPLEAAHDREKELLREVTDLQWRLICAREELQKYKTEHAHD
ncbi:OLC1v1014498C1 [Oldenlandia corymbosa var. corymbosa]|uniref:OLC1v1014498C1 n=1 Tax=Oldenlandia corymbosa var. corymbosa TaxID=529605 RepID=A0AAV1E160_OLDCO|nr:OLC1v1014498C1 [Oldenlandia corymbosa var. corymbosa]